MIERIFVPRAAAPRGHYAPAVRAGDFVFVSGHVPTDPATGEVSKGTIEEQTLLALNAVKRSLAAAGATPSDVVRVNVYLKDASDWAAMNTVYAGFFGADKPSRTTVAVSLGHPDMKIEIDCIAYCPPK